MAERLGDQWTMAGCTWTADALDGGRVHCVLRERHTGAHVPDRAMAASADARAPLHSQPIEELERMRRGLTELLRHVQAHRVWTGEYVDYRTESGSWRDVEPDIQALLDGRELS